MNGEKVLFSPVFKTDTRRKKLRICGNPEKKGLKRMGNCSIIPSKPDFPEKGVCPTEKGEKVMVDFGILPSGQKATLYTISNGILTAKISDYGATLVSLLVPNTRGEYADVVLGFEDANDYAASDTYFGATVGRNANRIGNARFELNGKAVCLEYNDNGNNLHSGPRGYSYRVWTVEEVKPDAITFVMDSPDGDQGFPGKARIWVTYTLEYPGTLKISYKAVSDADTVFNLTNHSYFNLAGHDQPQCAMEQTLMMPARVFTVANEKSIPTGEIRSVVGTPMDFRKPKALGRDIGEDYEPLKLQLGYDHNFEVFCQPCAILRHEASGRAMAVRTDCPGIQVYSANYTDGIGKGGIRYGKRSGVALETQFYPDSVNHPEWKQPVTKAGQIYSSVTRYCFEF